MFKTHYKAGYDQYDIHKCVHCMAGERELQYAFSLGLDMCCSLCGKYHEDFSSSIYVHDHDPEGHYAYRFCNFCYRHKDNKFIILYGKIRKFIFKVRYFIYHN